MDSIVDTDKTQAEKYQQKYKKFEQEYFSHFMTLVQNQANNAE